MSRKIEKTIRRGYRDLQDGIRDGDLDAWKTFFRDLEDRAAKHMMMVSMYGPPPNMRKADGAPR
jgi:hypothetical protein